MAKFITGKELEDAIYNIIWDATRVLMIVSPFIKLDDYFKKLFDRHANNPELHIIVVFGKNEVEVARSLSKEDFDYFKKFLNITIIYVSNLHAKYYGNEQKGMITSINLYDFSFKNNIEFGVYSEVGFVDKFTSTPDQEAWRTCMQIAESNEAVFVKRPVYEKKILSLILGKNYVKSDVLYDTTENYYGGIRYKAKQGEGKKMGDFPQAIDLGATNVERPKREEVEISKPAVENGRKGKGLTGYCIRTGIEIPFNVEKPLSYEAYKKWSEYGDPDYPENYCHFSGEPSNGETSVSRPILRRYWKTAKGFIEKRFPF